MTLEKEKVIFDKIKRYLVLINKNTGYGEVILKVVKHEIEDIRITFTERVK